MRTHRLTLFLAALALTALVATPVAAQDATLKVKVKPKTGYTLVDGQPHGQGKRTIRLSAGEHEVSILRYGYKPHVQKFNVTAGQVTSGVNFNLSQGGGIVGFVTTNGTDPLPNVVVIAKSGGIERGSALYKRLRGGGLVVSAVEPGSRAFQAGFRPADIIVAVNRRRVQTLAEFQAATKASQGGYAVSLLRGDFNVTLVVR